MNGLPAPTYTQVPSAILDTLPAMKEAELRVTLAIARATFGWHRPAAAPAQERPAAARPPERLIPIPPDTPCFLEVMLLLDTARRADDDERDRVLNCARNIIRNHWPLDWRAALTEQDVPPAIQQAILSPEHQPASTQPQGAAGREPFAA